MVTTAAAGLLEAAAGLLGGARQEESWGDGRPTVYTYTASSRPARAAQ